jgi:hypothetical protein
MDNIFVERLWRSFKYDEVYLLAASPHPSSTGARSVNLISATD